MLPIDSSAINIPPSSLATFNPIHHLFRVFGGIERLKFHLPVRANTTPIANEHDLTKQSNRVCKTTACCGSHQRDAEKAVLVPRPTREPHHFHKVVNTDIERSTDPSFRSQAISHRPRQSPIGDNQSPHKNRLTQNANQSDHLRTNPTPSLWHNP